MNDDVLSKRAERYVRAGRRLARGRSSRDVWRLAGDQLARGANDRRSGRLPRADRRLALGGVLRVLAGAAGEAGEAALPLMSRPAAEALRLALLRAGERARQRR